jgi:hypothetical protein
MQWPQHPRQQVRAGIAYEKRRLEEHHGDRPHRRRTAEPRQDHLGEHRLHGKQQQGRNKQCPRIERGCQPHKRGLQSVLVLQRRRESNRIEGGHAIK